MTSHKVQIQALIQSIDGVLSKASPRLPWVMAGEAEQQRLVLEQARQYLVNLQQQPDAPAELPAAPSPLALPGTSEGTSAMQVGESAQQVLQAVLQEVTYLRTNIMQPMRSDVDRLRQERDELEQEIQELKAQRQQYALPPAQEGDSPQMVSEFLQSLMGRLQENLTVQVSEMLNELRFQSDSAAIAGAEGRSLTGSEAAGLSSETLAGGTPGAGQALSSLTPQERLEQLQRIQSQSDQLLLKLDSTLRVIFESLQRNMHTYEESLSRGLDKMHTLGQQGEAIFTALVNRLAQQLGREASSYLQASLQAVDWQALPGSRTAASSTSMPLQGATPSDSQSVLDALLSELTDGDTTILQPTSPGTTDPDRSGPPPEAVADLELESPSDVAEVDPAIASNPMHEGEITTFQIDEETLADTDFDDEEITTFQMETPSLSLDPPVGVDTEESAIEDIDSALELLNQISTDLEADATEGANPEAEVASPEGVYNELDALYESLFGDDLAPTDEALGETPVDRHVADAQQWEGSEGNIPEFDALSADDQGAFTEAMGAEQWDDNAADQGEQLEEFESQLFEGWADLSADDEAVDTAVSGADGVEPSAAADAAELKERLSGLTASASSQAIEHLLFDEVPVADEGEQEETLLLGGPATGQGLPADVITSLEELMHLNDASATSLDLLRSEGVTDEDAYIAAAPDEDLLVDEEDAPRAALDVDPTLVEQLDAELSRLEGAAATDLELPLDELESGLPEGSADEADALTLADELADAFASEWESEPEPEPDEDLFSALAPEETLPDEAAIAPPGLPDLADSAPPPPLPLSSEEPTTQVQTDEVLANQDGESDSQDGESDLGLDDWLSESPPIASDADLAEPTLAESLALTDFEDAPPTDRPPAVEDRSDEGSVTESAVGLPPDREDLTLDDFQSVMADAGEPVEEEPLWAGFGNDDEDDPERTLLMPPQASPQTGSNLNDASPSATGEPDEDITLERFSNYLVDLPPSTSNPIEPPAPAEEGADLASLFAEIDDTPDAVDVPPPSDDESLASFVEAVEASPSPTASDNAFTLEGLGGLFEDVEDLDAAPLAPQPSQPLVEDVPPSINEGRNEPVEGRNEPVAGQMPSETLGSDFGLAEVDFYADMEDHVEMASASELELKPDPVAEAEPESAKKKDLSDRHPEALVPPPPGTAIAPDDALTPTPTSQPEEVVDLSEQLMQAMGLSAEEAAEEVLSEDVVEEWSDADFSLMELAEDFSGASGSEMTDPDALALLRQLDARTTAARHTQPPPAASSMEDQLSDLRHQEEDLDFLISPSIDPLDDLYDELEPPPMARESRRRPVEPIWYLGIDLGTTGISAVLLNRKTQTLYPMYWLEVTFPDAAQGNIPAPEKTYRLPTSVYISPTRDTERPDVAIASLSAAPIPTHQPDRFPLQGFKPYLQAGIPYSTPDNMEWEPVLQWTEQRDLPLSQVHQVLRTLLASLNCLTPDLNGAANVPVLSCGAVGLSDEHLQGALQNLAGVIVSQPANSTDTFSFNVREAVLAARLVDHPEQIYVVEEAIATLLSALPSETDTPIQFPDHLVPKPDLCGAVWHGGTLVLDAGASLTEMAVVNLPNALQTLSRQDVAMRTIPYGGSALDQDILCQLVYPAWVRQAHRPNALSPTAGINLRLPAADSPTTSGDWADPWAVLGWEQLTLPIVGDPDPAKRFALQGQLLSSPIGLGLLETAQHLKWLLQQQDRAVISIGQVPLVMTRQDLASRVLLPYIQRLNRELNGLLTQKGLSALEVNQVLCAGGTASLAAIARWLRQKFPNATFVQDAYPLTYPPQNNQLAACGRVAFGLATVPLHSQVIDVARHQYSDYFLLMELLRTFPESPVAIPSLLQMLERRGINVQECQTQLLALLQGYLPPGLVPIEQHAYLLTQESQHNPDYQALLAEPLFIQEDVETYRPNPQQWALFRRYLDTLLATSYQKLTDPLGFGLRSDSVAMP